MGRGDKKSKKGKIFKGSFGNSRSKKAIKARMKRATMGKTAVAKVETEAEVKPKVKRVVKKKEAAAE
jgi:ribosomal small subunit protein bTHX